MGRKPDNALRLMLHNINRLPIDGRHSKSRKLFSSISNKQIDVAMLTEIGLYWPASKHTDRWYERVREIFKSSKAELSFNSTEPELSSIVQFGGTGVMAVEDFSHRVIDQGADETGLGRWSWLRLEGKQNHHLRVVSAYRPVDSLGVGAVHSQHERFLTEAHRDIDPRAAFFSDLFDEVATWKDKGDHIIIGLDANEDVRTGATRDAFRAMGMQEIILNAHGHRSPPATCDKNTNREPIDGIFTTPGIRLIAGGYAPFNDGCPSDHRFLWIDVPMEDVFGFSSPALVAPGIRRLNTKNPKMTDTYNLRLSRALETEALPAALHAVERSALEHGWSPDLEDEYNRINARQYEIRKAIEQKIRHIRTGVVPWCPRLQTYRTVVEIWSLLLKKRKGRKVSNRRIRRLLSKTTITDAYEKTIPQIEDALDKAFDDYRNAREHAVGWRDEFFDSLAQARSESKSTTKEKELQQLRTIEQQRTVARNIKRMQGRLQRNATTQIYVTDAAGRHVLTDKTDIEDACIQENTARFSQSNDTPPMSYPLLDDLGYLADTPESQAILDGTYQPPPGVDDYAVLLLRELRMPDNVRTCPMTSTTVTPAGNQQAWMRQKEAISSEPEGLTFSHYKAGSNDPMINLFDAKLRSLPYQFGFSPSNWQDITDVEILKKAGVYDIEKMRTITLMDAAFNMNNKQLGKDLMAHAEKLQNLAREQYGSRKHHQSSTAATNKVLTMDLLRLRRQAGALCSNDAKSCYDRVVHSIAALSMLRQGAPRAAVDSLLKTLQMAKHKIRTGFGVSKSWFGRLLIPLQGLGQGNGVAPTAWAVISTVLIEMMRKAGFGVQMDTCLSLMTISFLCYAFVDDTDLVHTGPSVDTPGTTILSDMRRFVNHWEGGLRATGGALRVDKSYWYLIDFIWDNNRWRYATKQDLPGEINVRDSDGIVRTLPRLDPQEANETLGVFIAMDGNQVAEVSNLRSKAEEFAEQVRTGFVTPPEAWHALNSTIMKTFEYPMDAISLTKTQWDYIMAPILKVVLPKSGIVRTFPHKVLYSPTSLYGMGLMHPFYRQNLKHLRLVLYETLRPSITNDLLIAALEQLRLESGLPCPDGDWQLHDSATFLTDCWLKDLLFFCEEHEITVQDTRPKLQPMTTADLFLMSSFILANFTPVELRSLNECRMFLHVVTLSDLCTADRRFITVDGYDGTKQTRSRRAGWPRQPQSLPLSSWQAWKRALHQCFLFPNTNDRRLRVTLGKWLPNCLDEWSWFFSPSECRLYHKEGPYFHAFSRNTATNNRASTSRFSTMTGLVHTLPTDVVLATTARLRDGRYHLTSSSPRPLIPLVPTTPYQAMPIKDILMAMSQDDRWAVYDFHSSDEGHSLASAIIQGKATAVSDGSFKDQVGTSGFVLRGCDRVLAATGSNIVPGNRKEQSAYRSELAGILGSLSIIRAVCKKYDVQSGSVLLALDGSEALKHASSSWPLSPQSADFDLLSDIRAKVANLPITVQWQWIRGHQDKHTSFAYLDPLAQDNVLADAIARVRLHKCGLDGHSPHPQRFGNEGWSISFQGRKLSHMDFDELYSMMWADTALEYWSQKHAIEFTSALHIDWDACGDVLRDLPFAKRRRMVKHASGHFGIGKKMKQWGFEDKDECPLCQLPETAQHVLLCKDRRAVQTWRTSLMKLDTWMTSKFTDPTLQRTIILKLQDWHDNSHTFLTPLGCEFLHALSAQNEIGWYPFVLGMISNHWRGVQQAYYEWLGRRNTGRKWVRQLILQLFNVSWDLWEHRNGIKHNTPTAAKLRNITRLNDDITSEYATGVARLMPRDKRWFKHPIKKVLDEYTAVEKEQWLTSVKNARHRWVRRAEFAENAMNASRRFMLGWLGHHQ